MRTVGRRAEGQTGTEYMLVISVIVIAVVGAAYAFVPQFEEGVNELGRDVSQVLATGDIGGIGHGGTSANASGSPPFSGPGTSETRVPGTAPGNNKNNGFANGSTSGLAGRADLGEPMAPP